jgi:hypothetical protein
VAIRELRSWLQLAGIDEGAEDGDTKPWEDVSAAERAVMRARIAEELRLREEGG